MGLITVADEHSPLEGDFEELQRQVREISEDIAVMRAKLRAAETSAIKDAGKVLAEIRQWKRAAMETEAQFETRNKERAGIVHAYALDLDAARASVEWRLDRLASTIGAG